MVEDEKGGESGDDTENVPHKADVEVGQFDAGEGLEFVLDGLVDVEFEADGDEDAGDHNVAQTQHAELPLPVHDVGVEELDGDVEVLGHGDHDVGAVDPEDVVEEEQPEQDEADLEAAQTHAPDGHDGEQDAEDVVEEPVPGDEVERHGDGGQQVHEETGLGGLDVRDV